MPPRLTINPRRVALVLSAIAVFLALQSIAARVVQVRLGDDAPEAIDTFLSFANINREQTIPTWFNASLLLLCALILGVIAAWKRAERAPFRGRWLALTLIFAYLSADEMVAIHEFLTDPLGETLETTGPLYFAWVIAGAAGVVLFGLAFFRFWRALPAPTRLRMALAAALYVGGSLGVELIGANLWYEAGGSTLGYSAVGTVEELMEMLGLIVFAYALLAYIGESVGAIRLAVSVGPEAPPLEPADRVS